MVATIGVEIVKIEYVKVNIEADIPSISPTLKQALFTTNGVDAYDMTDDDLEILCKIAKQKTDLKFGDEVPFGAYPYICRLENENGITLMEC